LRSRFPRLYQIYEKSKQSDPEKIILSYLFGDAPPTDDLSFYEYWESLFQKIDKENWDFFKAKAAKILTAIQKYGRVQISGEAQKAKVPKKWSPFRCLDTFNEVHGYLFLMQEIGCGSVKFLKESKTSGEKKPDLEGWKNQTQFVLDVKTINRSDDEHADSESVANPVKGEIKLLSDPEKLINLQSKIRHDICVGKKQLNSFPQAKKIIFFVINIDGSCNRPHFREQLSKAIKQDIAMTNEDITICGKFQLNWNPSKGMEKFNWS